MQMMNSKWTSSTKTRKVWSSSKSVGSSSKSLSRRDQVLFKSSARIRWPSAAWISSRWAALRNPHRCPGSSSQSSRLMRLKMTAWRASVPVPVLHSEERLLTALSRLSWSIMRRIRVKHLSPRWAKRRPWQASTADICRRNKLGSNSKPPRRQAWWRTSSRIEAKRQPFSSFSQVGARMTQNFSSASTSTSSKPWRNSLPILTPTNQLTKLTEAYDLHSATPSQKSLSALPRLCTVHFVTVARV